MSAPASRRGFLRGLTTLPLIGGGVALIGSPSAVAEPVTEALRDAYLGWLAREYTEALVEREVVAAEASVAAGIAAGRPVRQGYVSECCVRQRRSLRFLTEHCNYPCPPVSVHWPSSRAALVLSTVGYDWRGAGHERWRVGTCG